MFEAGTTVESARSQAGLRSEFVAQAYDVDIIPHDGPFYACCRSKMPYMGSHVSLE